MNRRRARITIGAVAAVLAAVLILQNLQTVTTRLLFIDVRMPAAILIAVCLLLGFAIGAAWRRKV